MRTGTYVHTQVGDVVFTDIILPHYYEGLRNAVDAGERGWREFDSSFGDGKVMLRLQDIRAFTLVTERFAEEKDAQDRADTSEVP